MSLLHQEGKGRGRLRWHQAAARRVAALAPEEADHEPEDEGDRRVRQVARDLVRLGHQSGSAPYRPDDGLQHLARREETYGYEHEDDERYRDPDPYGRLGYYTHQE